ncbi:TetR/AcrR family transcriptional regulator [Aquifex sp.]
MGEKRSSTREKILEVALKLFSRKGFKETTIKDIAREVGITEGAIYRHFTSKEEIINNLLREITEELRQELFESIEKGESDKERLNNIIDALLEYAFTKPESFRFLNLYHLLKDSPQVENLPGEVILKFLNGLYLKGKLLVYPEVALAVITGTVERVFVFREKGVLRNYTDEEIRESVKAVAQKLLKN